MSQNPDLPVQESESNNPVNSRRRWRNNNLTVDTDQEDGPGNAPSSPFCGEVNGQSTPKGGEKEEQEEPQGQNEKEDQDSRPSTPLKTERQHSYVPKITSTSQSAPIQAVTRKFENQTHGYVPLSPNKLIEVPYDKIQAEKEKKRKLEKERSKDKDQLMGEGGMGGLVFAAAHPNVAPRGDLSVTKSSLNLDEFGISGACSVEDINLVKDRLLKVSTNKNTANENETTSIVKNLNIENTNANTLSSTSNSTLLTTAERENLGENINVTKANSNPTQNINNIQDGHQEQNLNSSISLKPNEEKNKKNINNVIKSHDELEKHETASEERAEERAAENNNIVKPLEANVLLNESTNSNSSNISTSPVPNKTNTNMGNSETKLNPNNWKNSSKNVNKSAIAGSNSNSQINKNFEDSDVEVEKVGNESVVFGLGWSQNNVQFGQGSNIFF